jgi:hypothetical protein
MGSDADLSPMPAPRYARFSRRLSAMLFDWIIALIVIYGAVLLAATVGNDNFSRALGILVIVALVLYEPILVSRIGGTRPADRFYRANPRSGKGVARSIHSRAQRTCCHRHAAAIAPASL